MKPLSADIRAAILNTAAQNQSTRQIAALFGIHHSTVARIINEHEGEKVQPTLGRPRKLTAREERLLVRKISSGEWPTAVSAQQHLENEYGINITARSIQYTLRRNGLKGRARRKKPLLGKKHRRRRYDFALRYRKWNLEHWKHVIWSDESKFSIFGSDGRQYCWRRPKEPLRSQHVIPTVKYGGGGIMVWGCMTWQGVGFLCRIDGTMDANLYQTILGDELLATLQWYKLKKGNIYFQHDNDPKHTAKSTKKWLIDSKIKVLGWPAQSPDLNPIEHLWNEMDRRLRKRPLRPRNKDELWDVLQEIWEGIEPEFCQKLISSMPRRLSDIRKAKGGYVNW